MKDIDFTDYWKDITFQCERKYERLIDLIAIKRDKKNGSSEQNK